MRIKKELTKRQVGGDYFLIPLGKTVYEHNGIFVLTELGAFIWDLLPEAEGEQDILTRVLEEYDVSEETARTDIEKFLQKLRDMEII